MQWLTGLQRSFDEWIDTLDNELVEDVAPEIDGDAEMKGAAEMDGVEEAQDVDVVMQTEMDGEEVHQFDLLTAGEQVIFDVMFDIHHPNFYLDDNGVYRFRED